MCRSCRKNCYKWINGPLNLISLGGDKSPVCPGAESCRAQWEEWFGNGRWRAGENSCQPQGQSGRRKKCLRLPSILCAATCGSDSSLQKKKKTKKKRAWISSKSNWPTYPSWWAASINANMTWQMFKGSAKKTKPQKKKLLQPTHELRKGERTR